MRIITGHKDFAKRTQYIIVELDDVDWLDYQPHDLNTQCNQRLLNSNSLADKVLYLERCIRSIENVRNQKAYEAENQETES